MKKLVIFHICALLQLYVKQNESYLRLDPPWKNFLDPRLVYSSSYRHDSRDVLSGVAALLVRVSRRSRFDSPVLKRLGEWPLQFKGIQKDKSSTYLKFLSLMYRCNLYRY